MLIVAMMKVKSIADSNQHRHKWFWDNSIETKFRNDTYRYRVIDQATDITILPEDEEYDPMDDETKIKILYVGLPFKDHRKSTSPKVLHPVQSRSMGV